MKIKDCTSKAKTVNVNGVIFGTPIELTERPAYWPDFRKWTLGTIFILTAEYYTGPVGKGYEENAHGLLIVDLEHGIGFGLHQNTQVIERPDVIACPE